MSEKNMNNAAFYLPGSAELKAEVFDIYTNLEKMVLGWEPYLITSDMVVMVPEAKGSEVEGLIIKVENGEYHLIKVENGEYHYFDKNGNEMTNDCEIKYLHGDSSQERIEQVCRTAARLLGADATNPIGVNSGRSAFCDKQGEYKSVESLLADAARKCENVSKEEHQQKSAGKGSLNFEKE